MFVHFEWDSAKAVSNQRKHGVSFDFDEAASVFFDPSAIQYFDDGDGQAEDRFLMLGVSSKLRILLVCHCVREDDGIIRIISARKATRIESRSYSSGSRP